MLNPEEQAELQMLEAEEAQAQQVLSQPQGLTPEEQSELAQLEAEEMQAQQLANTPQETYNPEQLPEADLGAFNRIKYSIEPLESNRRALLIEQFGAENVKEDQEGNLLIKRDGQFRQVNKPGLSFTDVADFAGSLPEGLGATVGGFLGLGTGGAATIPGIAGGAALGSGVRQGISAALGTPQVAPASERAIETGLSAVVAGGAGALGSGIKKVAKSLFPASRVNQKLKDMAKKLKIEPTIGQLGDERDIILEKQLAEAPIFGRKIKKAYKKQVDQIKSNLNEQFGDFSNIDSNMTDVGSSIKEKAGKSISAIKETASNMFDEVAEQGTKVGVDANQFNKSLKSNFKTLKLFDDAGNPRSYTAASGLERDQFKKLQNLGIDLIDAVNETAENGLINANDVNTLRKTIDANITASAQGFNKGDVAMIKMREAFNDITEDMLKSVDSKLSRKFREARGLYSEYLNAKGLFEKSKGLNLKGMSDEKVLDRIFRDDKSAKQFVELLDDKSLKEAGDSYVNNILRDKIGDESKLAAKTALNAIRKKRDSIKRAIGAKEYQNLVDNLEYLDVIGKPINPSGTALANLRISLPKGAINLVRRKGREKTRNLVEELPLNSGKRLNLLSDPFQRNLSFAGAGPKIPYRGPSEEEK